jgi:hypothetical protein
MPLNSETDVAAGIGIFRAIVTRTFWKSKRLFRPFDRVVHLQHEASQEHSGRSIPPGLSTCHLRGSLLLHTDWDGLPEVGLINTVEPLPHGLPILTSYECQELVRAALRAHSLSPPNLSLRHVPGAG